MIAEMFIKGPKLPCNCSIIVLLASQQHLDAVMLCGLLGLLVLWSVSSAMMPPHTSTLQFNPDDFTPDPNTFWSSGDGEMSSIGHRLPAMMPHRGQPDNEMTDGSNRLRMLEPRMSIGSPNPGQDICDMLLNPLAPVPVQQIPPYCFCSQCKGTTGPKGIHGDAGPPGVSGSPGRRGLTGYRGRPGFTGSRGMKGQKGDLGQKGEPGTVGFTGTKGSQGYKGEKGQGGMEGPAGTNGLQGEDGTCPASCQSALSLPGLQGPPGTVGVRGLPGVQGLTGPNGVEGDQGAEGESGYLGKKGQKGPQGDQGQCQCSDGAQGKDGTTGGKGAEGDTGAPGAQGLQGSTGLKGEKGEQGLAGPRGLCSPTIQSAFSACLNQSYPAENQPVPFPHVLTNQQGHFAPLQGVYTAPVNGTYVFTFHLAVATRTLKVGLFRNYYPVAKVTEGADKSTCSCSHTLQLYQDDKVWLQVKDQLTNGIYTDRENSATFSGYLLRPESCLGHSGRNLLPILPFPQHTYSWDGPDTDPPP